MADKTHHLTDENLEEMEKRLSTIIELQDSVWLRAIMYHSLSGCLSGLCPLDNCLDITLQTIPAWAYTDSTGTITT